MVQMLGWFSAEAACASRSNRARGLRVARHVRWEELQRHKSTQAGILGLINDPHAPAAEFLDDSVVGDGLANQGGWIWHIATNIRG